MKRASVKRISSAVFVAVLVTLGSLGWTASAFAGSAPTIEGEAISGITERDATLAAQINPNGLETSYEVRLESGCPYEGLACDAISVQNLPIGKIPASSEATSVSVDLREAGAKLRPGERFGYWVIATNSAGTTTGPGGIVRTQSETEPKQGSPSIESESLSHLTPTDASLEAQINTEGLETTYEFKLLDFLCSLRGCALAPMQIPLPSGKLLGSFVGQSVSLDLNSAGVTLQPGTEYGYSVTATNAAGSVNGPWHQFEPPSLNAQTNGMGSQVTAMGSPPAASLVTATGSPPSHRRKHKTRRHRREAHRARGR